MQEHYTTDSQANNVTGNHKSIQTLFRNLNSKNIVYNKIYYKITGSVTGAVLLSHLAYLFSEVFGGKEFYQSDNQLMESLGFTPKTLRVAKTKIKQFATAVQKGIPAKNHWVINENAIIQAILDSDQVEPRCAQKGVPGGAQKGAPSQAEKGVPKNKELQELRSKNKENICSLKNDQHGLTKEEVQQILDRLWERYPLKKAKQRALGALHKILNGKPREEAELLALEIWRGLDAYVTEYQTTTELKKQGANVWCAELAYLATWLNQERWSDQYKTAEEILGGARPTKSGLDLNAIEAQWG